MTLHQPTTTSMHYSKVQVISAVFWPSFVFAGIANSLFFAFIDPYLLITELGLKSADDMSVYSVGFFAFWALIIASSICTQYLLRPLHNANKIRKGE